MVRAAIVGAAVAAMLLLPGCARFLLDWPANPAPPSIAGPAPDGDLRAGFDRLAGAGPIFRATVRILEDNAEAWRERWRLIGRAQRTIDVSYFILAQDRFGLAFLGLLLKKAEEGVRVRLFVDALGMLMWATPDDENCVPLLAQGDGASVKVYRPIARRVFEALFTFDPAAAIASNHDKMIIVDGAAGLIGGRNVGADYAEPPAPDNTAFHDVDVLLEGRDAAARLTAAFERLYASGQAEQLGPPSGGLVGRCLPRVRQALAAMEAEMDEGGGDGRPPAIEAEVRLLNSLPRLTGDAGEVGGAMFGLLRHSEKAVVVESPYVVLTEEAAAALQAAGRRGVALTIATNSPISSDNAVSQAFFRRQWAGLLADVPGLRLVVGATRHNVHGKLAVYDRTLSLVGTLNLDPVSLYLNGELAVAIWSAEAAARLEEAVAAHLRNGAPGGCEYRIARDAAGRPLRDGQGRPIPVFGPDDVADGQPVGKPPPFWPLLEAATLLPSLPALYDGNLSSGAGGRSPQSPSRQWRTSGPTSPYTGQVAGTGTSAMAATARSCSAGSPHSRSVAMPPG